MTLLTELTTADIIYSFFLNAIGMRIKNNKVKTYRNKKINNDENYQQI